MFGSHTPSPALADIMIYDEESDRHVHIPFEQALYATGLGGGITGDVFGWSKLQDHDIKKIDESLLKPPHGRPDADAVGPTTDLIAGAGLSSTMPTNGEALKRIGAELDDKLQVSANMCFNVVSIARAFVAAGVWLPVEIVIARPFIEHLMLSAIVAVAGRDTGATLFGPADMSVARRLNARTQPRPCAACYLHALPWMFAGRSLPTPPSRQSRGALDCSNPHTNTFCPLQHDGAGRLPLLCEPLSVHVLSPTTSRGFLHRHYTKRSASQWPTPPTLSTAVEDKPCTASAS